MDEILSGQAAAEMAAKAGISPAPEFILTFPSERAARSYQSPVRASAPFQVEIEPGKTLWCRSID